MQNGVVSVTICDAVRYLVQLTHRLHSCRLSSTTILFAMP